jgi:hypothetical protein
MKKKSLIMAMCVALVLVLIMTGAVLAAAGGQTKKATGPFIYDVDAGSATFLGTTGGPYSGQFDVTAPSGGSTFPSAVPPAPAIINVFGIEKVAGPDGTSLLMPVDVALNSPLGILILNAFSFDPSSPSFNIGQVITIQVTVNNPGVTEEADYGDYIVTMKSQSPGSGIGVGSGSHFKLSLRAAEETDTTPPNVKINSPSGENLLGQIPVSITANDPTPGTGVESITATVSSDGGTVSDQPITLTTDTPKPAGEDATGTGTFTPTGGTGTAGTIGGPPFISTSRSGIGSYKLTAKATDGAGNVGTADSSFQVNYNVQFTTADGNINSGHPENSFARFKFTVKRSATISDGAFMVDQTVVVRLVKSDGTVVAEHGYGTGDIKSYVQIDTSAPVYQTNFVRGDLLGPPSESATYKAQVFFKDVDGTLVKQEESSAVTF